MSAVLCLPFGKDPIELINQGGSTPRSYYHMVEIWAAALGYNDGSCDFELAQILSDLEPNSEFSLRNGGGITKKI